MRIVLKQWLTDSDSCDKVYNVAKRFQQITSQAAVAQSVERRIGSAEVTGPIPVSSFFCCLKRSAAPRQLISNISFPFYCAWRRFFISSDFLWQNRLNAGLAQGCFISADAGRCADTEMSILTSTAFPWLFWQLMAGLWWVFEPLASFRQRTATFHSYLFSNLRSDSAYSLIQ